MQRLLVSVRGKNEAIEASEGGAHIIDVEYPGSALGTPYPLNIYTVRKVTPLDKLVATNIGEKQFVWSTASPAALGVALAGADIIKVGLAELKRNDAKKVLERLVKHVHWWFPWKPIIPAFFADNDLRKIIDPISEGPEIAKSANAQGVLIDTFNKKIGKGILDYLSKTNLSMFANNCHRKNMEAWIAGSIEYEQLSDLWKTGVDVVCIRKAACEKSKGRMGKVKAKIVKKLVDEIP